MFDPIPSSLSPIVYMAVGILTAALSITVVDQATSAVLLAAACCSMALTGVRWGQREAALVRTDS